MPRSDFSQAAGRARATRLGFDGRVEDIERAVPIEAAVGIVFAPTPYAVMMASPVDLEDFAYGFSLTEGVVERAPWVQGPMISRMGPVFIFDRAT